MSRSPRSATGRWTPPRYPYVWIDALTQRVREGGRIVNVSALIATGVNKTADRREAPGEGERYCAPAGGAAVDTATAALGLPGFVVLAAAEYGGELELLIETTESLTGCPHRPLRQRRRASRACRCRPPSRTGGTAQQWRGHPAAADHFMTHLYITEATGDDRPEAGWGDHFTHAEYHNDVNRVCWRNWMPSLTRGRPFWPSVAAAAAPSASGFALA